MISLTFPHGENSDIEISYNGSLFATIPVVEHILHQTRSGGVMAVENRYGQHDVIVFKNWELL